jgi:segregation and condensation protein B
MSLKSKLEAVIYAAEEPVTLAQLAGLFAEEALAWKAEQDAAAAAAREAEKPAALSPTLPSIDEGLEYLGLDQTPEFYSAPAGQAVAEARGVPAETQANEAESLTEDATEGATDAESEAKRAARARDREVKAVLRQLLDEIMAGYEGDERGIEIREIAGGYRMATKPEYHDAVRQFIKSLKPAMKLSLPALETLAVIAYKQPVTAPEVNEIRGVESAGVLGSLLSRKLITTAGRKQVIGRPILYKTTKEFLLRFGLKDVSELPSMEEFEKMAASELDDSIDENAGAPADGGPDLDENAPEEGSEDAVPVAIAAQDAGVDETATAEAESNEQAEAVMAPHD